MARPRGMPPRGRPASGGDWMVMRWLLRCGGFGRRMAEADAQLFAPAQRSGRKALRRSRMEVAMQTERFIEMPVSEIMRRWPATIGVFIDLGMHCVGCPIGMFHTLMEAADEHRIGFDRLVAGGLGAIAGGAGAKPEPGRP